MPAKRDWPDSFMTPFENSWWICCLMPWTSWFLLSWSCCIWSRISRRSLALVDLGATLCCTCWGALLFELALVTIIPRVDFGETPRLNGSLNVLVDYLQVWYREFDFFLVTLRCMIAVCILSFLSLMNCSWNWPFCKGALESPGPMEYSGFWILSLVSCSFFFWSLSWNLFKGSVLDPYEFNLFFMHSNSLLSCLLSILITAFRPVVYRDSGKLFGISNGSSCWVIKTPAGRLVSAVPTSRSDCNFWTRLICFLLAYICYFSSTLIIYGLSDSSISSS